MAAQELVEKVYKLFDDNVELPRKDIEGKLGINKRNANSALYALLEQSKLELVQQSPPVWRKTKTMTTVQPTPLLGQPTPPGQPTPLLGQPTPPGHGQPTPLLRQPTPSEQSPTGAPPEQSTPQEQPTPLALRPTPYPGQTPMQKNGVPKGGKEDKPQANDHEHPEKSLSINLPDIPESTLEYKEQIGRGAYSTVHKAHHKGWLLDVAVKRLKEQIDVGEKDLLYSEVKKMLIASTSPHIIDIRGICLEPQFGIVMTYMENRSLRELLLEHDIPLAWALRWRFAHEISLGLNFLHSLNPQIIHCDVKAANVLLDKDFHVKIADFGLAKWRTASRVVKSVSPEGATPTHAPPEYFRGDEPDAKFDVYSFGITLWEILTRQKPHEHIRGEDLGGLVRGGTRPNKDLLPDDADSGMVALMEECWVGDTLERPHIKDVCSSLAKGGAKYSDLDMLDAIITIKERKGEKAVVMSPEDLSGRQLSFHDLK